jgi:F-box domain
VLHKLVLYSAWPASSTRPAAMASIDDLPLDVLKLVLTQVIGSLQLKSDGNTVSFLNQRCTLASVCKRWAKRCA